MPLLDGIHVCLSNFAQSLMPGLSSLMQRQRLSFLLPLLSSNPLCFIIIISIHYGKEAQSPCYLLSTVLEVQCESHTVPA